MGLGVRLEHVILYPLALYTVFLYAFSPQSLIKQQLLLFSLWGTMAILFLIRSLAEVGEGLNITRFLSDSENFLQPLAILIFFLFLHKFADSKEYKKRIQKTFNVIVFMLCLNTLWSLVNIFTDMTAINVLFWGSADSVSSRAITNGRFSGIFNQPMEAGVAYSLGLMIWLYLMSYRRKVVMRNVLGMILLVAGGLLTVSKVFLFGGLPLFLLGVFLNKNVRNTLLKIIFIITIVGYGAYYFFLKTWTGFDYLLRFFGSNQDFITLLTAGRFGDNSQQAEFFAVAWKDNWLLGQGFGAYEIYDSAYFNIFANGGLIGMVLYVLVLLMLVTLCVLYVSNQGFTPETKLFLGIVIMVTFAGFGAPVFTLNRVSILVWVTLGMLIQYNASKFLISNFRSSKVSKAS
jgi:hypothetical protein